MRLPSPRLTLRRLLLTALGQYIVTEVLRLRCTSGVRQNAGMLELAILGFLYDTPLHGYELRKRITALTGHVQAGGREHAVPGDQATGEGRTAGPRDASPVRWPPRVTS